MYSRKYNLANMTCDRVLFYTKQRLLKSVFPLTNEGAFWRFNKDPAIGEWSLRSGSIFRHTDSSVTAYGPLLQAWVI